MIKRDICSYSFPDDLMDMTYKDKELLSIQIREFLLDNISITGGHIASNLGAVELTIAIHSVFNVMEDKLIWDVGHQSYVHKILTGRAGQFRGLRQLGGISGFPKTSENISDRFDTGHASNSISVASGFAVARDMQNADYNIISVIGDGSLTGGLAYEGLNNLADLNSKVIIILNDNGMSISPNTGGLSKNLSKARLSPKYYNFKKGIRNALNKIPAVGKGIYSGMAHLKEAVKYTLVDGIIFEQLGLTYMGTVDGHNIRELEEAFRLAKAAKDSVVIHVVTKKGKGYKIAEENPADFHGIGPFDRSTGKTEKKSDEISYSSVFGNKLCDIADKNPNVVAVSAAMVEGTGLRDFAEKFPKRCFDVGIAEGHAVTFAGAMALSGLKPFVAIYSTFLQRAYDNIILDVCLQNAPVTFCLDRAGAVGADGETHHGLFDISYLKNIPNLISMAPRDGKELEAMMEYALSKDCPVSIRYPRGNNVDLGFSRTPVSEGAEVLKHGDDVEIWALGTTVQKALDVALALQKRNIDTGVVNARFISPLDVRTLQDTMRRTKLIVTLEDGILKGGFGESVKAEAFNFEGRVINIGFDNEFLMQGTQDELYHLAGLDISGIENAIIHQLKIIRGEV